MRKPTLIQDNDASLLLQDYGLLGDAYRLSGDEKTLVVVPYSRTACRLMDENYARDISNILKLDVGECDRTVFWVGTATTGNRIVKF